ncbi:MAG: PAS domain S-box protein, partial [Thermodesulfobacteriota bacterium]
QPLGAVVLRSDVDRFLYPLVQNWPVVSRTAETLLVRRDGDAVLFLNNLRHQRAAALTLRLPLSLNRLPAAQAVLGRRGVMLGRDYRGIQVLAVVGPVPHSSWFMVAKIDEAEAMADWREQQQLIFFLLGALLFSGAAATLMVWQRNAKAHYEALYRAEAALRESESRYRQLFESNPQPMWVYDIETLAFLAVNDAAVRGYGYSREEFLRMTIADIRPAEDVSRLRENVAAVTEGLDEAGLWRHRKKDGTLIDVEITSHTLEFAGRKAEVVLAHDVTEQRRAEDALRESELRFRTLADSGQALIWTATTDKLCDYFNRPWLEFTGRALEQELGNGWAEGVHPDDFSACLATYVRAFDRREKFTMSYRLRRHDGVYRWIVDTGSPRYDSQGNFLGYIGHCLDITERKEAEEALRESDIRYRQLYQKMGSGVAVYEARDDGDDFIIKDMNLAGLRSSQVTEEEIIGRSVQEVFPGVKALGLFDVLRRVWQTGTPERLPAARYEDSRLQLWVENEVYKLPSGEIVCVYNDITERREAEEAREALQSQLLQAQKMEAVGRLAGGVAHDFNNMLQAILGYTELSRSMVEPGSPLEENIREITTAARRSADLTRQLLAFARRQPANPKVLDLNETVSGMLKMLRRLVGEDIDLAWMPALELWPVHIDPSQLDQILANLLVNARDAIATVGKVTIGTENAIFDAAYCAEHAGFTPGEYVMLAVSDDGCGMDRETLRQVFEPFFTTKPAGQGTGLGLATVYGIVKQNDGFINVYSEPGQGTTFKIYLPRCAVEEVARATSAEVVAPPRGTETVLLVEDERMILALGRSMLERLGYTVLAASTVAEALQLAEEHANEIALLITDVVMPEMNGRELAARLLSVNPRLRFLFMSGYTADVIAHRGMLEEGVRFLQKPFSIHELAVKVREALAA